MNWMPRHLEPGLIVSAPTTSGTFKDVSIIVSLPKDATAGHKVYALVSLLDGLAPEYFEPNLLEHLNKYRFTPVVKMISRDGLPPDMPENRIGLPAVAIILDRS